MANDYRRSHSDRQRFVERACFCPTHGTVLRREIAPGVLLSCSLCLADAHRERVALAVRTRLAVRYLDAGLPLGVQDVAGVVDVVGRGVDSNLRALFARTLKSSRSRGRIDYMEAKDMARVIERLLALKNELTAQELNAIQAAIGRRIQ